MLSCIDVCVGSGVFAVVYFLLVTIIDRSTALLCKDVMQWVKRAA